MCHTRNDIKTKRCYPKCISWNGTKLAKSEIGNCCCELLKNKLKMRLLTWNNLSKWKKKIFKELRFKWIRNEISSLLWFIKLEKKRVQTYRHAHISKYVFDIKSLQNYQPQNPHLLLSCLFNKLLIVVHLAYFTNTAR